jgi:hypothetical protein
MTFRVTEEDAARTDVFYALKWLRADAPEEGCLRIVNEIWALQAPPVAILNAGGGNVGQQQKALCVYEKMPLLALDLLARVEPRRASGGMSGSTCARSSPVTSLLHLK